MGYSKKVPKAMNGRYEVLYRRYIISICLYKKEKKKKRINNRIEEDKSMVKLEEEKVFLKIFQLKNNESSGGNEIINRILHNFCQDSQACIIHSNQAHTKVAPCQNHAW